MLTDGNERERLRAEVVSGNYFRMLGVRAATGRLVAVTTECSNPLVEAIHLAFSRHLPLTLSPDVIWLTIVQGFSHHVNQFPEALRGRLVTHQEQRDLVEQIDKCRTKIGLSEHLLIKIS